jgi:hypothetical protein
MLEHLRLSEWCWVLFGRACLCDDVGKVAPLNAIEHIEFHDFKTDLIVWYM